MIPSSATMTDRKPSRDAADPISFLPKYVACWALQMRADGRWNAFTFSSFFPFFFFFPPFFLSLSSQTAQVEARSTRALRLYHRCQVSLRGGGLWTDERSVGHFRTEREAEAYALAHWASRRRTRHPTAHRNAQGQSASPNDTRAREETGIARALFFGSGNAGVARLEHYVGSGKRDRYRLFEEDEMEYRRSRYGCGL